MKELYSRMKGSLNLKRQYVQFSILSLLYFVLYTLFSVVLGAIVHDAATIIGFWILNLISTYVYMRFFFRMAAGMAKAENIMKIREDNNLSDPVYIGDTIGDFNACRKAGVPFIFAEYGFGQVDKPDYRITRPFDLTEICR